ncbi:MAG: hypothetical protein WB053_05475 [Nitrososphaeraceae archaeon]|jgi:hypothetical protein
MNKKNIPKPFLKIVDDLILKSGNDTKLAESIRWIDLQSRKNMVSFYEMAYILTDKQLTKKRAQQWVMCKENQRI